jgi:hypothetical protein
MRGGVSTLDGCGSPGWLRGRRVRLLRLLPPRRAAPRRAAPRRAAPRQLQPLELTCT